MQPFELHHQLHLWKSWWGIELFGPVLVLDVHFDEVPLSRNKSRGRSSSRQHFRPMGLQMG